MSKTRYFMFVVDLEHLPLYGFPRKELTESEYNLLLPHAVENCEADDVRNGDLLKLLIFCMTTPDILEVIRRELEEVLRNEGGKPHRRQPKHDGKLN